VVCDPPIEFFRGACAFFRTLGQSSNRKADGSPASQEGLAKNIGTTRSAVCRYERQPTNLTLSTLEKVVRAMGRKLVVKLA